MDNNWGRRSAVLLLWTASCALEANFAFGANEDDALVVRAVHPDRQASGVLKLFEGARAPHPAAAVAAWKRATRDPAQLGKTVEAFIALANPEMVPEWRNFDQAELRMNFSPTDGSARWHFVVPHDDGTAAPMITAFRLSDLEDPPPIIDQGREYVVTRFIRTANVVLTHVGSTLVFAGTRDELAQAVRRHDPAARLLDPPERGSRPPGEGVRNERFSQLASMCGSGVVFDLRPRQIAAPAARSLELRRAIELLHALGCDEMIGKLALEGERLVLDVTTQLVARDRPSGAQATATVDPAWLALLPSPNLIGVVSLAFEPTPQFWSRVFAVADQVERVDPVYQKVASLRTRFNLIAKGGGLRPEAELWPHLRGITAAALGDPQKPGRLSGGIVVLHADTIASAAHLADEFVPRLSALGKGKLTLNRAPEAARLAEPAPPVGGGGMAESRLRTLGTIGGRMLAVRRIDREVLVGWGDAQTLLQLGNAGQKQRSAADVCCAWARSNNPAPSRLGALWPGRLPASVLANLVKSPAAHASADDPPVVWWGWNEKSSARDIVFWADLAARVRRFLDEVPMDAPPYR